MSNKKEVTLARLREALKRLISGRPLKVKPTGKLTLNKINNEAGLGGSYIHKLPVFKAYVEPIIETFNRVQVEFFNGNISLEDFNTTRVQLLDNTVLVEDLHQIESAPLLDEGLNFTKEEMLKAALKREQRLKESYRQERNDIRKINTELEILNSTLMYRLYELQNELHYMKVTYISGKLD